MGSGRFIILFKILHFIQDNKIYKIIQIKRKKIYKENSSNLNHMQNLADLAITIFEIFQYMFHHSILFFFLVFKLVQCNEQIKDQKKKKVKQRKFFQKIQISILFQTVQ